MKAHKISKRTGEKGFSLIELLISIVLFLIVTGAIFGLMHAAKQGRTMANQQAPLNKSVRVALNLLGRDTYNAGFGYPLGNAVVVPNTRLHNLLDTPLDTDSTRDDVPPIIAGNDLIENHLNPTPGTMTDQVTFLAKDPSFNLVGADPETAVSMPLRIDAPNTVDGIDEIVPVAGINSACSINDLFLVTGNTGSTLAVVTGLSGTDTVQFSNGDVLNFNRTGASGTLTKITTPASMQRVRMVTYFVTEEGVLVRREYANSSVVGAPAFVDEPLVYNVTDFQIEYVMNDGSISDNPEVLKLEAVRQVRFTIGVQGTEHVAADQPLTVTMTSTFSTRNLGYDAN